MKIKEPVFRNLAEARAWIVRQTRILDRQLDRDEIAPEDYRERVAGLEQYAMRRLEECEKASLPPLCMFGCGKPAKWLVSPGDEKIAAVCGQHLNRLLDEDCPDGAQVIAIKRLRQVEAERELEEDV